MIIALWSIVIVLGILELYLLKKLQRLTRRVDDNQEHLRVELKNLREFLSNEKDNALVIEHREDGTLFWNDLEVVLLLNADKVSNQK